VATRAVVEPEAVAVTPTGELVVSHYERTLVPLTALSTDGVAAGVVVVGIDERRAGSALLPPFRVCMPDL
jgi:hypothetical protein